MEFLGSLEFSIALTLLVALFIAFAFEFVNGFHDTANAVATVIYTRSLPPTVAVVWSGIFNFLGVISGGIAVAYSIVNLLPTDILTAVDSSAGKALVLSLLISAIMWNLGTWYLGIPCSSSHTLIGAIIGAGLIHSVWAGQPFGQGVNWKKAWEIALSLILSPLTGFVCAALLLLLLKRIFTAPELYQEPSKSKSPPWWIRLTLIGTCTGVSYAHGSNDGQKGMGLIMLILIGFCPAYFALNLQTRPGEVFELVAYSQKADQILAEAGVPAPGYTVETDAGLRSRQLLAANLIILKDKWNFNDIPAEKRMEVRKQLLELDKTLIAWEKSLKVPLSAENHKTLRNIQTPIKASVQYVPTWVILGVAFSLGIGTMVGWKRIVITVGEKIGKSHLTYAQGASAEAVAMGTILAADYGGLPVSTTQVLSSGVAGTMCASGAGVQAKTITNIALAWVLTLPATILLSAALYSLARLVL